MEENKKSEFLSKVEAFAKEVSEMTKVKGTKRSILVLAADSVGIDGETRQIIGVAGNGDSLVHSIAKFASQEDTKPLLKAGLKLSMIEDIANKS